MKCKECRDFKRCLIEAITRNQIFDAEYEGADCFTIISNADHIRSMSDEELADYLVQTVLEQCPCSMKGCEELCNDCILEWLKQPYEEKEE